jgi:hypothetical protein
VLLQRPDVHLAHETG